MSQPSKGASAPSPGKFGIVGGVAAALLAAAAFIEPWEGTVPVAYYDVVRVLTICTGHTGPDVYPGQRATPAQCQSLLVSDIGKTYRELERCARREVTQAQAVSLLSLGFNIGGGALCKSTLMRQLNAGEPAAVWCKQILRWDFAGGRKIRGLTRRREAEYKVCIGG